MWKQKIIKGFNVIIDKIKSIKNVNINKILGSFIEKIKKLKYEKYFYSFIKILLAMIIILLTIGISSVFKKDEVKNVVITDNKAEDYFYAGSYDKSIEEYKNIMENDKKTSWWETKISEVYSVKGDIENSRKHIAIAKKAIVAEKDLKLKAKVDNYIVFTEFMNKDYKVALEDGKAALNLFPRNTDVIKTMFTVYMANNETKAASDLISSYPYNDKSAYDIAEYSRMLMLVGRWDEGLAKLRFAWGVDKDEYKIYDVLSQSFSYNKDVVSEKLTTLSTKNPTDVAYKMWLAKIYSMSSDTSEQAKSLLDSFDNADAGKIEVKLIKASVYQNMNQLQKSDELINSIIKQYPNDYRVLHTAGWYYLNKKDYEKALKYCKESIVKNKNYPDNYGFLMPEILKAKGASLEGEPYFRIALSKEPYNYNIMLNIANFYWITSKNTDKSIDYFKMAEIIKPSDAEIKFSMANVYLNASKIPEAIDYLSQSIKIDASVPKYHRMLGTIYLTQKKPEDGIREIRLAYHADEQDILTLSNAGCYYITYEADLERGIYNLQKAVEGINSSTDAYTKEKVNDNLKKANDLKTQYSNAKSNDKLKIPEFTLFY